MKHSFRRDAQRLPNGSTENSGEEKLRGWALPLMSWLSSDTLGGMNSDPPATGTAALLELRHAFVPDDFINCCRPRGLTGGRRRDYRAARLYRIYWQTMVVANARF